MTEPSTPELIRANVAAAQLHVHPGTLKRWSDRGVFPQPVRLGPRGDRFYRVVDIEQHLTAHTNGATV
jgi:predicted DNA-binding transcriptional regulator AlpA